MHPDDSLALARRFIALPVGKRKIFWESLAEEGIDFSLFPIPGGQATGELSYAQQRMWLLWTLDPDSAAYHIATAVRLKGVLDVPALERALADLPERHRVLRTVVRPTAEGPRQSDTGAVADLVRHDLDGLPPDAAEARLRALCAEAVHAPFDLAAGPLLRSVLVRRSVDDHVLLLVVHHIAADGWSLAVLVEEFARLYEARRRGVAPALPPLPVQYADYAVWQRRWLEAGEGERQLAYWRRQLDGAPRTLDLPLDRPRPAVASQRGDAVAVAVPDTVAAGLAALAQRHRATPFMVLAAAFAALLHRHGGPGDLCLGVPVANRNRAEIEGLVGFFVNTQVLRVRLDGRQGFASLLDRVRDTALEAQSHQDLPFEQLVEALQPERTLSHNPLVQVMVNHAQAGAGPAALRLGELAVEPVALPQTTTQVDLHLNTRQDAAGRLSGELIYATDLFDRATVERLAVRLVALLTAAVAHPDTALDDLPLMDAAERTAVVSGWNDTAVAYDTATGLLARIAAQVAARPDAPAVVEGERGLTYAGLNARANRLAHRLRAWGVGPDVLVGVAAERSLEMVVALLAVMKAGGAYVPLDADQPAERLAGLLVRSGAAVLLTQAHLLPRLPDTAVPRWCLDRDWAALDGGDERDPPDATAPLNLAYCIFTSGSTGRPKPVGNTRAGLLNRLLWMQDAYRLTPDDVVLQKTPFGFDVSVWEFFWPLMTGATLAMAPPGAHRDPAELRAAIVRHGVTTLHFVPSMLRAFVESGELPACTGLRRVLCSGEALPEELARRFHARHGADLHNLYGPTEAAIDVTAWTCRPDPDRRPVPIGRPIANTRIHILDPSLNPVPVGVAGELHIGGINLARGYLGQPGLTAERFVPDPLGPPGGRLYRSGDRARWRDDGAVEYLGRTDDQVKIRGRRIEPGEIEACLAGQPGVRQAAVVVREAGGAPHLVAYVAAAADEGFGPRLRERLAAVLPDYMVPAHVVVLDRLPLSPNGKLDRRALPAPAMPAPGMQAPATETEWLLAEAWAEVLGCERVGATDNFFELGGDSIVAIQAVGAARRRGLDLSPRDLFRHQTVRALAGAVRSAAPGVAERPVPGGAVELLPIQRWFFEQPMAERRRWNQAVLLRPRAAVDRPALAAALTALTARHDALRLRFRRDAGGVWRQAYAPSQDDGVLWQRDAADEGAFARHVDDAHASLDLAEGPLLRALLLRRADGEERLLLVIHHLVVDGVSWRILLEDLAAAYAHALAGAAPRLPPRTSSLQEWAARLATLAAARAGELGWWEERLAPGGVALPADDPGGACRVADAARFGVTLGREETRALLQEVPAAYRTRIDEVLLTALARTLCRWAGGEAVIVQTEGHGREEALAPDLDLSRTVGWFTSLYPVRLAPGPLEDLRGSLLAVKEQWRAVPDRGVGYGLLRHLAPAGDRLAALPAAEITFNYLGQFDQGFPADAPFVPAPEPSGEGQAADAPLLTPLTLDAQVHDGRLRLVWGYSRARHRDTTVADLAAAFRTELSALVGHCLEPAAGGLTPSDVPLAGLDQAALDRLPFAPRTVADLYPLTPLQQGILFHGLYEPGGAAYLNQIAVTVDALDPDRFAAAWQAAVERHDVLRSAVLWQDGAAVPVQVVLRNAEFRPEVLDWRGRADAAAALDALALAERRRGLDLAAPPLMRLVLVRLDGGPDGGAHRVLWTFHHIMLDGWSAGLVMAEVLQRCAGEAPPSPPAPFRDHVAWLLARDTAAERRFWSERLAAVEEPTLLADALGDADRGEGHGALADGLDAAATARLQAFARARRVTVNTLVQAAWLV
ncbi:amino acid adenylation domain-containing protein, partial [Azospirillum sp. A39]|uniref:amino acid adenylation domain-containing protein n=1 Tax=Azospirillum sp. A39 TaxID=3462279 RepID=UPI004046503E